MCCLQGQEGIFCSPVLGRAPRGGGPGLPAQTPLLHSILAPLGCPFPVGCILPLCGVVGSGGHSPTGPLVSPGGWWVNGGMAAPVGLGSTWGYTGSITRGVPAAAHPAVL